VADEVGHALEQTAFGRGLVGANQRDNAAHYEASAGETPDRAIKQLSSRSGFALPKRVGLGKHTAIVRNRLGLAPDPHSKGHESVVNVAIRRKSHRKSGVFMAEFGDSTAVVQKGGSANTKR
jgi:hypothetical protein